MTDPVLGAFVGVVVGAVVTGGVQTQLARLDRKLASRTAARLLYMTLIEARGAMTAAYQIREWHPTTLDWDAFGAAWIEHREALARALEVEDFMTVALAFSRIQAHALMKADHLNDPPPPGQDRWDFTPVLQQLHRDIPICEAASEVVGDAALGWRERRRVRQRRASSDSASSAP